VSKDTRGLNTGGSDNKGDQGGTDSDIRVECRFGGDGGGTEFRWMRRSTREGWNQNKGDTKGGNDKISMVQNKLEKDWR